jgi:hypothetical protein
MTFRHWFDLSVVVFTIILGYLVYPENAIASYEYRLQLKTLIDESTLKPLETQPSLNQRVTVLERRGIPGPPPRQRNVEVSSQHIVVLGVDEIGRELARVVINDPRLIRAEIFDSSGEIISTKLIYREFADILLVFPEDPRLFELKFYHPKWTGVNFTLEPIGEAQLH